MPQASNTSPPVPMVGLAAGLLLAEPGAGQKSGGVFRSYNSSNPPAPPSSRRRRLPRPCPSPASSTTSSSSTSEAAQRARHDRAGAGRELGVGRSRTKLTVQAQAGRQVARRQAVHRPGRAVHLAQVQGKHPDEFRNNPRGMWWSNLQEVTINGDFEATFVLARPQASFPALLASSLSPVYPCHVSAKDMRTKPIGTGPFKFVSFDSNDRSSSPRTPTTGSRVGPISMASSSASWQSLDAHPRVRGRRVRPDLQSPM